MTAEELLAHATEFTFLPAGASANDPEAMRYFAVRVVWRKGGRWAVTHMGDCWSSDGWQHESLPDSRTDTFLAGARFPLEEAAAIARSVVDSVTINGFTWAQWEERRIGAEAGAA